MLLENESILIYVMKKHDLRDLIFYFYRGQLYAFANQAVACIQQSSLDGVLRCPRNSFLLAGTDSLSAPLLLRGLQCRQDTSSPQFILEKIRKRPGRGTGR